MSYPEKGRTEDKTCPTCGGPALVTYYSHHPFGAGTTREEYKAKPCACGEPAAKGYVDLNALADYNAGRRNMLTLFKVRGLHTERVALILPAEEESHD